VLDPLRGERFTAVRGEGALHNGAPLARVGAPPELAQALVCTGFGYAAAVREAQAAIVAALLPDVRDIRRPGSAALDLAWTAAGRYDAYYEFGVQRWDYAAGALVCREAGLETRALPGGAVLPPGLAVAAPPLIDALVRRLGS
jgi:myo-inositol-1(or 4)-monophosphatase